VKFSPAVHRFFFPSPQAFIPYIIGAMNLAKAFSDSVERAPSKEAVFWGEEVYTYAALEEASHRLATHLVQNLAVRPGDRVGLWLRNRPEFVTALFGVLKAGGVVVPINNFLKPEEMRYILQDSHVRVVISDAGREAEVAALTATLPGLRIWEVEQAGSLPPSDPAVPLPGHSQSPSDLAVLIYTSGTTGHPKGAMLSHQNLLSNVESCRIVLAAVDADRFVVLLPMFHSFMLCVGILLPLLVGGSMVLIRSLHPPKNILAEIAARQATILPAVPQFFRTLLGVPSPETLPLRVCLSGGAPLPVELFREFNRAMHIPLIEGYGLSEASPVVSLNPIAGPHKEGSIGLPIPGVEVAVMDDQGRRLDVGEVGEICVRGQNVMLGYWNRPEETATALREGWLCTGDIGYGDADGFFFITDRKKDMLLVNGINVYPREIEEVLYQFKGVQEAAVVGIQDRRRGEQPVAFVSLQEGTEPDTKAMLAFLKERLADYKVPRRIHVLPKLPRNATGKILKTALRDMAKGDPAD